MSEYNTHKAIVQYITAQYPKVRFHTDMSGVHLTNIGTKRKAKALNPQRGFPDLVIYEARHNQCGLALEIKKPGEKVYKMNGELRKSEHLENQAKWLTKLQSIGFEAHFVIGFHEAKEKIDKYLKQ